MWKSRYGKGKYSASNTLLIDDEPHVALLNPKGTEGVLLYVQPNTAIFPQPYKKHNSNDTFLGPNGELQKYLEGVADADDVTSYVKDKTFGQRQITASHPNWDFYSKVVRRNAVEDDDAQSSTI